ncbi:MAG: 16S rRNA (cytosine(967)-C(5))-methyltransferase RsmB [Clostridia bacterium]|nr:16S rRNA (cytosine(967)-C(5))-methyltransferase RsmB [Clostridia bacterium]
MKGKKNAREIAAGALYGVFYEGAYSNLSLKSLLDRYDPTPPERALASELVYGVIQNYRLLDAYIASFSKTPPHKLQRRALIILRMAFYQLLYLERIPKSAAVSEAVKMARKSLNLGAAGYVNGVLRAFLRSDGFSLALSDDAAERLALKYSLPEWMAAHFIESYGSEAGERIICAANDRPAVYIRLNSYRASEKTLINAIEADGADIRRSEALDGAYVLSCRGDPSRLNAFRQGMFFFQDITSQFAVRAAGAREGDTVMDVCAAPGAKSFAAAQYMHGKGRIYAFDLYENRVGLIKTAAERLGISIIDTAVKDAEVSDDAFFESADAVIADVPCSGLGTMAKKPDIRLKSEKELFSLPETQNKILNAASKYVKPGGTLIYSTCTLNPSENEEIVSAFLKNNPDFTALEPDTRGAPKEVMIRRQKTVTFLPDKNFGDGFFIAKMIKERRI